MNARTIYRAGALINVEPTKCRRTNTVHLKKLLHVFFSCVCSDSFYTLANEKCGGTEMSKAYGIGHKAYISNRTKQLNHKSAIRNHKLMIVFCIMHYARCHLH